MSQSKTLTAAAPRHVPSLPSPLGSSSTRILERLLVIEDNEALRATLVKVSSGRASEVRGVGTVAEAEALIRVWVPNALVLDFLLPDGTGFDVLRVAADGKPMPAVVAISGIADPDQSFQLAQMGVRAFVSKPIELERLERALDTAINTAPDVVPFVRAIVGHLGVHEVEETVRATMVSEAMAHARGSRHCAARLLSISRQLLQYILKKDRREHASPVVSGSTCVDPTDAP
jgi:two-component system response regulator RegA